MKTFLTTTALVAALAAPGFAQEGATGNTGPFVTESGPSDIRASDFIGSRLYTTGEDVSGAYTAGDEKNWNDVGEIHDVIMGRNGQVEAILVDLGGFLGIGEKTVAVSMDELTLVSDGEDRSDYFVVFRADRTMLESAPEFDMERDTAPAQMNADTQSILDDGKPMDKSEGLSTDTSPEIEGVDTTSAEIKDENAGFPAPAIEREGFSVASADVLNTEDLTGARVYDLNDEWVGDVSELLLDDDGKISEAVIDVGGFLGIGEKPVVIQFEGLTITTEDDGDEMRVYLDATKDQLKDLPPYEG